LLPIPQAAKFVRFGLLRRVVASEFSFPGGCKRPNNNQNKDKKRRQAAQHISRSTVSRMKAIEIVVSRAPLLEFRAMILDPMNTYAFPAPKDPSTFICVSALYQHLSCCLRAGIQTLVLWGGRPKRLCLRARIPFLMQGSVLFSRFDVDTSAQIRSW